MPSQREDFALRTHLLEACTHAARTGADYVRSRGGDLGTLDWQTKSRADFVSEVDTGAEERIGEVLRHHIADARVLGEELSPGAESGDGVVFIVDPLDGTTNFLHGYPEYAVSIAALVDGDLAAAVVLDVPHGTLYHATARGGAYRDDSPIRVSHITDPLRALVGTGFPFKHPDRLGPYLPQLARILGQVAGVRRAGSAALDLAHVASGHFDGFWELMLAPWDIAAGVLLVREAGGRVSDLAGGDVAVTHTPVAASNGVLHDWLLAQLAEGDAAR